MSTEYRWIKLRTILEDGRLNGDTLADYVANGTVRTKKGDAKNALDILLSEEDLLKVLSAERIRGKPELFSLSITRVADVSVGVIGGYLASKLDELDDLWRTRSPGDLLAMLFVGNFLNSGIIFVPENEIAKRVRRGLSKPILPVSIKRSDVSGGILHKSLSRPLVLEVENSSEFKEFEFKYSNSDYYRDFAKIFAERMSWNEFDDKGVPKHPLNRCSLWNYALASDLTKQELGYQT